MPKKLLFTAQARGFGPASKALHIANMLHDYSITFIGKSVAFEFSKNNSTPYNSCINSDGFSNNELCSLIKEFDLVISFMNQDIALLCYELEKPYLFFDSLFGYWKVIDDVALLSGFTAIKNELSGCKFQNYSSHEKKLLAHFLSSGSYIQNFIGVESRFNTLKRYLANSQLVIPFVTSYIESEITGSTQLNDLLLINIGGVKGRDATHENIPYVEFIEKLSLRIICEKKFQFRRIVICSGLNSKHRVIKCSKDCLVEHKHMKSKEFVALMRQARVVMSSPGLTTILESIYMKKAIIFLPEQHGSQSYNMLQLKSSPLAKLTVSISEFYNRGNNHKVTFNNESEFFEQMNTELFDAVYRKISSKMTFLIENTQCIDFDSVIKTLNENTMSMTEVERQINLFLCKDDSSDN